MTGGLHDERFVDDECRGLEAGVEIAEGPFVRRVAQRQRAGGSVREVLLGPLQRLELRSRRRSAGAGHRGCRRGKPDVAFETAIRAAGPQAVDRIDDERQRLEIEIDALDGGDRGFFVHSGERENRLALIERLVGQRTLGAAQVGKIVRRENRFDAGHRERRARVDPAHARVRHRAEQQLREEHAVSAIVLGVLRAARDLRHEVERRVVPADQL